MLTHRFRPDAPFEKESSFAGLQYKAGVLMVKLTGPSITEREATLISRELHDAFAFLGKRLRVVVLSMSNVHMLSSMGLGMCIDARNTARRLGATTVIYGLSPKLADLFRMMKVDRLYRMVQSEADLSRALAA